MHSIESTQTASLIQNMYQKMEEFKSKLGEKPQSICQLVAMDSQQDKM